ncbi:sphingomyelin phosphodiesterase 4-like isoform X2 [Varroa destructor]|nr:sphingomyelin phosphodiesterase 4-like isoform X2 [Varroa destructor]
MIGNLFEINLCAINDRLAVGEYMGLVNLLSPKGPVFQLVEKLTTQMTVPRVLLPLTKLPTALVEQLVQSNASHYLLHKLSLDNNYLQLNPIEYFLFHLIGHLVEPWVAEIKMDINNWPTVVYFTLFDRYLAHFLDCNEPSTVQTTILQSLGSRFHPCGRPVGKGHHCLLKKDSLLNGSNLSMNSNSSLLLNSSSRTMTLMNVLSELWFANPKPGENQQLQRAMCMLVKKLHSCGYFESNTPPLLRRRLYKFIRLALTTWPLDSSFRLPLEVWLAFIQPWRYASGEVASGVYGDLHNPDRYIMFIDQHLLFYTHFLLIALERISVLDLSLAPNVVLISRICKVFSQEGLMDVLLGREAIGDLLQHSKVEFEHPGFTFETVYSDYWRAKARDLIRSLRNGQVRVEARIEVLERSLREKGWWPKFWESLQGITTPNPVSDFRTLEKLRMSINKLAQIFRVEIPDINVSVEAEMMDVSLDSNTSRSPRKQLFDSRYLGMPEKQPPRSNEIECLLPPLERWSIQLNTRFGRQIKQLYRRRNTDWGAYLIMAILRYIILPPASYVEIHKERAFLSPRKHNEIQLPARFYLRPLAKRKVMYLMIVVLLVSYMIGMKLVLMLALIFVTCKVVIERVYLTIYPDIDDNSFRS